MPHDPESCSVLVFSTVRTHSHGHLDMYSMNEAFFIMPRAVHRQTATHSNVIGVQEQVHTKQQQAHKHMPHSCYTRPSAHVNDAKLSDHYSIKQIKLTQYC